MEVFQGMFQKETCFIDQTTNAKVLGISFEEQPFDNQEDRGNP